MAKNWIQGSIKRPGALTRKAKAAGMTVGAYIAHPTEEDYDEDQAPDQ